MCDHKIAEHPQEAMRKDRSCTFDAEEIVMFAFARPAIDLPASFGNRKRSSGILRKTTKNIVAGLECAIVDPIP